MSYAQNETVCMLARLPCAHFDASVEIFGGILAEHNITMITTTDPKSAILHPGPVLIMQLEQYTLASHIVAILRAVMGRRTAAMVFRAREALIGDRPLTRIKRLLLRIERKMSAITMMTILPLDLLPKGKGLFRSWIHDSQIWDIPFLTPPPSDKGLANRVAAQAKGRRVVLAVGLMEAYKGLEMLANLANDRDFCSQYLLVIAGVQLAEARPLFKDVATDCIIENRYISDGELYALYEMTDFVWAIYSPSYDQASGIFGRALQFGRTPIIREGSLIDKYAEMLGANPIRVPWQAPTGQITALLDASEGKVAPISNGRVESASNLLSALYANDIPQ